MNEPTGIIEPNDDPSADANVETDEGGQHPKAGSRFIHPSGSRPLEGYTIKRGVGVGGFGEVYYATSDAGKDVALKRIQRNLDVELRGVRQCLNLKHCNLLSLYDIKYDEEGQAWVVMEYVAGESLQAVSERNPNGMPIEQVHRWFEGLSAGVAHLHDCGIVHRDLKPGNIFLDGDAIKIGDYGLSKFISCSRRSGQTQSVGTFHYMAPEIGQGRYGKEIDIYALGIILYEMLTGHVPYDGESSQEIIMKHLTAQPDLTAIQENYRNIIARALAKDPARRFKSVDEMRRAVATCRPAMATAAPFTAAAENGKAFATDKVVMAKAVGSDGRRAWLPDEPIARALVIGWRKAEHGWNNANLGTLPKFVILLVAVLFMIANAGPLVMLALVLGATYGGYFLVRSAIVGPATLTPVSVAVAVPPPAPAPPQPKPEPKPVVAKPVQRKRMARHRTVTTEQLRPALAAKSGQERAAELFGSMLMAAFVAAVVGVVMLLVRGNTIETPVFEATATYAWTTLTSIVGAWTVLGLGKLWEGSTGDAALRRFTTLVAGLLVGLVSFGIAHFLLVRPTYVLDSHAMIAVSMPAGLHNSNGTPAFMGFLAYFAGLFLVLRWWKQTDPLRRNRLSVWSTLVVIAMAIVLHGICPFPRGFIIAATIGLAVQLSASWVDPEKRKKLETEVLKAEL